VFELITLYAELVLLLVYEKFTAKIYLAVLKLLSYLFKHLEIKIEWLLELRNLSVA